MYALEGLVIFIIIAIISKLLSRGKEEQKHSEQMPPFHQHAKPSESNNEKKRSQSLPRQRSTVQSFEDLTKKFLGDLKETANVPTQTMEHIHDDKPVATPVEIGRNVPFVESQPRNKQTLQRKLNCQTTVTTVIPKTRNELVQAVIVSEVLGLPKAKRK